MRASGRHLPHAGRRRARFVPPLQLTIVAVGLTAALGLWLALRRHDEHLVAERVRGRLSAARSAVSDVLQSRVAALARMADRWEARRGTPRAEWLRDARSHLAGDTFYRSLARVDASGRHRWVASRPGDEPGDQRYFDTLREEASHHRLQIRALHGRGGGDLLVVVPLRVGQRGDGLLLGLCDADRILGAFFEPDDGFGVAVLLDGRRVAGRGTRGGTAEGPQARTSFELHGMRWDLEMWARPPLMRRMRSVLPDVTLAGTGFLTFLLVLLEHQGRKARRQARRIAEINADLEDQVRVRIGAEERLKALAGTLEQQVEERTRQLREAHSVLADAKQQIERAVRFAGAGVWSWDVRNDRLFWDTEMTRIFGVSIHGVSHGYEAFMDLVHPDDRERVGEAVRRCMEEGAPYREQYRVLVPDGGIRYVEASGYAFLTDGVVRSLDGLCRDVTDRVLLDELRRSNRDLEQFAYVASHDLQEPLRMVTSYTRLLARRYTGRLDDDADEFIHYAVDGAERMRKMIEDILCYSRVGKGRPRCRRVDLGTVLDRTLVWLRPLLLDAGATVTRDALPEVTVDPDQMGQVFQNLLTNAIRFRGEEPPHVHVGAMEEAGEWTVSVQDNGIGMDPRHVERIFEPFSRLHTVERPGSGMGLAICRRIMERHGGGIRVETGPGRGSRFLLTLPRTRPSRHDRAAAGPDHDHGHPPASRESHDAADQPLPATH